MAAETDAGGSRRERDIRLANAKQVVHVAMVIIGLDHDILDLLLNTDAEAARCKRRLESAIDIGRKQLRRYRSMRNAPNGPQKKKPGALPTAAAA